MYDIESESEMLDRLESIARKIDRLDTKVTRLKKQNDKLYTFNQWLVGGILGVWLMAIIYVILKIL